MTLHRYSVVAALLHWTMAAALAFQIGLGFALEDIAKGSAQFAAYQFHKSLGMLILALTVIRILIRFIVRHPPPLPDIGWARRASATAHLLLYGFMLGAPLTGWLLVSTADVRIPTVLFGVVPLPHLPVPQALHVAANEAHELVAFLGIALIIVHIGGAARHQFAKGEPLLQRMVPWLVAGSRGVLGFAGALALMLVGTAAAFMVPWGGGPPRQLQAVRPADDAIPRAQAPANADDVAGNMTADEPSAMAETADGATIDPAPPPEPLRWQPEPGGRLGFTASWMGTPVEGSFSQWRATVTFDPEALDGTDVRVGIDLSSADTGDSQRDQTLHGPDFFRISADRDATFTARKARKLGPGRYALDGTLTLRGIARPMTLTFTLGIDGERATVDGEGALRRTSFGVGAGEWAATDQIADAVAVRFSFRARRLS